MPSVTKDPKPAAPSGKPTGERSGRHRAAPTKGETLAAAGMVAAGNTSSRRSTGKTSVTGKTAKGAVAGASTGAVLGSVVPGIGTAAGAGIGAAVGGTGGAIGGVKARKAERAAARGDTTTTRRLLVAEFVVCVIVLAFSPLTAPEGEPMAPGAWMKKGSAICGLFLFLGLVSTIGRGGAKVATSFGGLVVLVLMVNERAVFGVLAKKFSSPSAPAEQLGPPTDGIPA